MSDFILKDLSADDPSHKNLRAALEAVEKLDDKGKRLFLCMLCEKWPELYGDCAPHWPMGRTGLYEIPP